MWDDDGIENLELAEVLGLPYYLTTLPPYHLTILLSYHLAFLLPNHLTILLLLSYHLTIYLTQVLGLDVDDLNRLEQVTKIIRK